MCDTQTKCIQSTPFIADTVGTSSKCPYQRESVIAGVYFSQTSLICFCLGFSCCPFYRSVRYSGVSARRELTVLGQSSALILTEYEIKNLGTLDSPLQNKKFRDHQWKNVRNLHKSNLQRNVGAAGFVSIQGHM